MEFIVDEVNGHELCLCNLVTTGESTACVYEIRNISAQLSVIPTNSITKSCYFLNIGGKMFISALPNMLCY